MLRLPDKARFLRSLLLLEDWRHVAARRGGVERLVGSAAGPAAERGSEGARSDFGLPNVATATDGDAVERRARSLARSPRQKMAPLAGGWWCLPRQVERGAIPQSRGRRAAGERRSPRAVVQVERPAELKNAAAGLGGVKPHRDVANWSCAYRANRKRADSGRRSAMSFRVERSANRLARRPGNGRVSILGESFDLATSGGANGTRGLEAARAAAAGASPSPVTIGSLHGRERSLLVAHHERPCREHLVEPDARR
jgi:hypothetical protein